MDIIGFRSHRIATFAFACLALLSMGGCAQSNARFSPNKEIVPAQQRGAIEQGIQPLSQEAGNGELDSVSAANELSAVNTDSFIDFSEVSEAEATAGDLAGSTLADEGTKPENKPAVMDSAPIDIEATKQAFAMLKKIYRKHAQTTDIDTLVRESGRRKNRPLPVLPTQEKTTHESSSHLVIWDDYESAIEVSSNGSATVKTYNLEGKLLVSYSGKTYVSDNGELIVDARGAKVSGPWANRWSPDSFTIAKDGVKTIDDYFRKSDGAETPMVTN